MVFIDLNQIKLISKKLLSLDYILLIGRLYRNRVVRYKCRTRTILHLGLSSNGEYPSTTPKPLREVALKDIQFTKALALKTLKISRWIILSVLVLNILTTLHRPFYLVLVDAPTLNNRNKGHLHGVF